MGRSGFDACGYDDLFNDRRLGVAASVPTAATDLERRRKIANSPYENFPTKEPPQMNMQMLIDNAQALVADNKGLLAMDESNPTCNKRFAKLGIPQTVDARRDYRELIVTTPGLGECISGVILYDETIRQQKKDGTPFIKVILDAGIIPGIKVDLGAKEMAGQPGEKITEGLDGLRARLKEYFKWALDLPSGAR